MSYGRHPQYIYECACGGRLANEPETDGAPHPKERHVVFLCQPIRWDELAQFIATAHWRRELDGLVARGYELRPELKASQNHHGPPVTKSAKTAGRGGRR